jgi:hypothetical protein
LPRQDKRDEQRLSTYFFKKLGSLCVKRLQCVRLRLSLRAPSHLPPSRHCLAVLGFPPLNTQCHGNARRDQLEPNNKGVHLLACDSQYGLTAFADSHGESLSPSRCPVAAAKPPSCRSRHPCPFFRAARTQQHKREQKLATQVESWRGARLEAEREGDATGVYVAYTADLLREAVALDAARPTGIAADGWEPLMTSTTVLRATLDLQVVPTSNAPSF